MTPYERLLIETAAEREAFLEIPLIRNAVTHGVVREIYLDFLGQAFHHVRHTGPLLALAFARCDGEDARYRKALSTYLVEENGHEEWILNDIQALGGDSDRVRSAMPRLPCKVMVAYAYHLVNHVNPYALLGMVHVLEGMSVALAGRAASAIEALIGSAGAAAFSYLRSHGSLDIEHVAFFRELVDALDERHGAIIIDAAKDFYRLYGELFIDIQDRNEVTRHAA